jgi:cytoskeletal protein CcmA (bactofilin family)
MARDPEEALMFNLKARDRLSDPKDAGKPALKPALYDPPASVARTGSAPSRPPAAGQAPAPQREGLPPAPAFPLRDDVQHASPSPSPAAPPPASATAAGEAPGSKLFVGVNIKLKGVEITDCDVLVIEGHVEATVSSKVMQIAKPGTLKGTAVIDVAEVNGEFTGELTARSRLVVHSTGRVTGTVRYGQLIVAEGGEVSGDVKPMEASEKQPQHARAAATDARYVPPHGRGTGGD